MATLPPIRIRVAGGVRLVTGPAHRAPVAPDEVQLDLLSHVRASILDRHDRAVASALRRDSAVGDRTYFDGKVNALKQVLEDLDGASDVILGLTRPPARHRARHRADVPA